MIFLLPRREIIVILLAYTTICSIFITHITPSLGLSLEVHFFQAGGIRLNKKGISNYLSKKLDEVGPQ